MGTKRSHDDVVNNKKPSGHWAMGLLSSMNDPDLKVQEDDKIVIIKDKYPKVRFIW